MGCTWLLAPYSYITEYNPVPSIGRECPCGGAAAGRGDGDAFLATIVSAALPPAAPGHHDTRQPGAGDVTLQILFIYSCVSTMFNPDQN